MRRAFTLIELSIVLIIIGFLIGGISVGGSLIASSQLRSIITEYNNYKAAIQTFKNQYNYFPGDIPTASTYWPTSSNCPSNCNGNGDDIIYYNGGTTGDESILAWQHLSLANLINGSYTGTHTTSGQNDINTNVPASKFVPAGWFFYHTEFYTTPYTNTIQIGSFLASSPNATPALTSVQAYEIDVKIDDSYAKSGYIRGGASGASGCTPASTSTLTYNTTITGAICYLGFTFGNM